MAWQIHWQCCFQSLDGHQYAVNIYEQDYSGSIQQLTGAGNPFTTQEADDADIFVPIRSQSGYLRVVDTTGGLLEAMMPANNVDRLVRLYSGTHDGSAFTPQDLRWQGFLQAQAYTQPWDGGTVMLEFPVSSLLGALQDVSPTSILLNGAPSLAYLIEDAFNQLKETPASLCILTNLNDVVADMLKITAEISTFYEEDEVANEGSRVMEFTPWSYYDILAAWLRLYGMQLRELDSCLYLAMYDETAGAVRKCVMPWSALTTIVSGGSYSPVMSTVDEVDLLTDTAWAGDDNTASFRLGARKCSVVFSFTGIGFFIDLPFTEETEDAPVSFPVTPGTLYVQPHPNRDYPETFSYLKYLRGDIQGSSSYAEMLSMTVIKGYEANPYATPVPNVTGAFPCRWFYQEDTEYVHLKNGLYINSQYRTSTNMGWDPVTSVMYSITSQMVLHKATGWLRINFDLHNLIWVSEGQTNKFYFDDPDHEIPGEIWNDLYLNVTIGNKQWNGSAWQESHSRLYFPIQVKNGEIYTNKTADMNVDVDGGFFIPITEAMDNVVVFRIGNYMTTRKTVGATYLFCYSHILENLTIEHYDPANIVASQRTSNVYSRTVLASGFRDERTIDLSVGTFNNNEPECCFIRKNEEYVQQLSYRQQSGDPVIQRPEMNLLERMAGQFACIRRNMVAEAKMKQVDNSMHQRFTYLGRKFFAIKSKMNWRDDRQEVKFIEI